ncbi:MAG: 1-deoxy-D-xylulose-5-phosphate reductoisomerase [Clostridiales bacterium]|jgi:1-deoxy-D-xylulose-5-phosphate reductoisomerase|nr:1-deoxy-D-xylulose-5-phosphate reductoisomerase [Clostridiales bacterium]
MNKTKIFVIGSTGSIGTQTLNIVRRHPDKFSIVGLAAGSDWQLLAEQAKEFKVRTVGIANEEYAAELNKELPNASIYTRIEAQTICANTNADVVVAAAAGIVGIHGVVAALQVGKKVALANKEVLVSAGNALMQLANEHNTEIVPIDSEHSAIKECLQGHRKKDVRRLILTASGGGFYFYTKEQLSKITPEQAVVHPNWKMGRKISVDSSTMFNKGLELIEARWLYNTTAVDYIIHRESVIHSMVEYIDGSVIAQLSSPDMELPIQQAISNHKLPRNAEIDFVELSPMSFYPKPEDRFGAPKLARQLIEMGDTILPCVYSSANEMAVQLFLDRKIGFGDIYDIVERTVNNYKDVIVPTIDNVIDVDRQVKDSILKGY